MKLRIANLVMATAMVAAAQEPPVVREGAYWVGSIGDSFGIAAHARLQVNTRGNVTVRREAGQLAA